jgi:hypothetical protein
MRIIVDCLAFPETEPLDVDICVQPFWESPLMLSVKAGAVRLIGH